MVEKENLTMDIVRLDLNGDGKPDNLVRFGFDRPCDAKELAEKSVGGHGRSFYVIDSTLTQVDPFTARGVNISPPVADVFLFKGIVHTDEFGGMPSSLVRQGVKHDGVYWISEFNKHGLAKICTFRYFDSTPSKGGK
jgi:hypothetical protein